mmetsp:Transcript_20883/g.67626  ORF Transcript_20883/g.67626 Transcript_20883/m.67626 type:complete len:107 (+) Transcript_20883:120-440(+)
MALDPSTVDPDTFRKLANAPLIKQSDMLEEMRNEAVEICAGAVEKFQGNFEKAAQMIKDGMDKKFGAPWNAVLGEYYAFEIQYEVKNLLYVMIGNQNIGVLVWKSQ